MAAVAPIAAQPGASDEQPLPVADFVVDPTVSLLTITKPTPDAKLGLVMTAGASPKVHSLSPDGPAAAAVLMVGDAILTVNHAPVDTDVTAQQAMRQAPESVTLGFLQCSSHGTRQAPATPPFILRVLPLLCFSLDNVSASAR